MPKDGTATRLRLIEAAQRLMIDEGHGATSVDRIIAEAHSSKGSFFHHFASKDDLTRAALSNYVDGDLAELRRGLDATASIDDPRERAIAFVRVFEESGDALMAEQSGCLYLAVVTEGGLVRDEIGDLVRLAVTRWREEFAALLRAAFGEAPPVDPDAFADHLFVTFEGAFVLCRALGEPEHMRHQLGIVRASLESLLGRRPS